MSAHKERLYLWELENRTEADFRALTPAELADLRRGIRNIYGPNAYVMDALDNTVMVNPDNFALNIHIPQPAGYVSFERPNINPHKNGRVEYQRFGFISGTLIYWAMERGDWYQWAASPL